MDGSLGVAAVVAWSHMVFDDSSFWCELKWRRALWPSQLRRTIKARSYTRLVCINHGPRSHDPLAQCFGIGGAKYISFLCICACAKRGGVAKPWIVRGAFLFFTCVGAASDAMQSWKWMGVMARLCKRARARLGGAKWRNVFSTEVYCHNFKACTR